MTIIRAINDNGVKYDLDLLESIPFKLDISAIESGNIGTVFGVSSQQLTLPPSKTNNEFFGNLYDLGSTPSTSFTKTVPCQILQDGNEIFSGKLYLDSVITDNQGNDLYNVVVVNETVDFGTLIQDVTFGDLDFSSLNHDYTYGNITGSWDKTLLNGAVFYPLVNYGFDVDTPTDTQVKAGAEPRTFSNYNTPLRVDDFKPAIRVRSALDVIFDSLGYEYTSSLFSSGSYTDDIYMLATEDDKKGITTISPVSQSFLASANVNQDYTDTQAVAQVFFPTVPYNNAGQYDGGTSTFTADVSGNYQFKVQFKYEILNYNNIGDARQVNMFIYKNGAQFDLFTFDLTGTVSGLLNVVTNNYALAGSDEIEVYVVYTETASGTQTLRLLPGASTRFELVQGPTANIGGIVDLSTIYGDVSVTDFFQGLIEKFNLVIEPVKNQRNVLRIETFNDWVDAGSVVDWSAKVDYNKKWKIAHPLQNQPKDIKFTDVEDNTALIQYHKRTQEKIYGEFDYISESDLAEGAKTIGKYFAPTPIKGIDGAPLTVLPVLAEKDDSTQSFKRTKFAPRLLFHNGRFDANGILGKNSSGAISNGVWYFEDESGTVHSESDYGLASHLQATPADFATTIDLHFGNTYSPGHYNYHQNEFNGQTKRTAFEEYWSFYINELYDVDSRLVTLNIFLLPNEIPDIELNDKIFIDGHYYRINKIKGANVTREDSVEVELIKTIPRKLKYPRRRVTVDDTVVDITVDDDTFGASGLVSYSNFETGAIYTGSALTKAASRDGFSVYGTDTVVWNTLKPTEARFTSQTNIGLNDVDISSETIDTRGDNNIVKNNVQIARIEGSDNLVQNNAKFITVTGTENTIESGVTNSAIQQSTTSSISENTALSTIIGGENTRISGSNKSVVIGQDLLVDGGNSNIVIGNFDTTTKTVTDLINTVVINPNRDLESRENLGGEDFSGRAYIGSYQDIGSRYSDNNKITLSAGQTLYLTGSTYTNDSVYDVSWTGADGTANIYLPDVDVNYAALDKGQGGYKRYLRFTTDGTFDAGKNVNVNVAAGDYLNGQINGGYTLDSPYQNFEIYGVSQSYWRVLEAGVPDISNGGHTGAYGSFYDTTSQSIITSGSAQLVNINSTFASNKIALSGSGTIQMDYNGAYSFTYTAQVQNADNSSIHDADFWVKYNGVDYPNSSVRVSVPAAKNATTPASKPVTIKLLDVAVTDNDKIELYWRGDSTELSLNYETFGGTIPASPSVRAVIQAV